jgi:hypothetical protein
MRRRWAAEEDVLAAVVELADDGFCERRELARRFSRLGARELRGSIGRAVRRGLLLERRGPDGRLYLALTSEGWDRFRSAAEGNGTP